MPGFSETVEYIGLTIDGLGVLVILVGLTVGLLRYQ